MAFRPLLVVPFLASLGSLAAGETQTTPTAKVPATEAPRKVHVVAGVVVWTDQPSSLVAVRESVPSASQMGQKPVRRTVALVITAETHLILGKSPATIADIKTGDFVVARYAETPQGALALSLRAADAAVHTTPPPSSTPQAAETAAKEGNHR